MRLDIAGFGRGGRDISHENMLRLCETADRLGFGGVWLNEFRFQNPPQAYSSTLLLASAIFARTERLRVGTSIVVTPLYHPWLLAEEAAQLHWQSDGRLDLGIGRGTHPSTFAALGIDEHRSRQRFEQSYHLMRKVWTGSSVMPDDAEWPASSVEVGPLLHGGDIPVYLAGTTAATLGFAARQKLPLLLSLEPPETAQLATYNEILVQEDLPSQLARSSLSRHVCIAPTRRQADEKLDALLPRLLERRVAAAKARGRDVGGIRLPSREEFIALQAIVGAPEDCARQLDELEARTGIHAIRLVFNGNGAVDFETSLRDVMLLGEGVIIP